MTDLSNDFYKIAQLKKLNYLIATHCNISDVSVLSGIEHFDMLDLSDNNISDISPLANVTADCLFLNDNIISNISSLNTEVWYSHLELANNKRTFRYSQGLDASAALRLCILTDALSTISHRCFSLTA